jgi:hypothetical protein
MKTFNLVLLSACVVSGHMEIKSHPPRTSKFSEYYKKEGKVDYDLKSPLANKVIIVIFH